MLSETMSWTNILNLEKYFRNYLRSTMNEASQVKPILIGVVFSDGFSSLEQVLDLGFIKVWVTLIHHIIQQLTAVPYAHLHLVQFPILLPHSLHLSMSHKEEKKWSIDAEIVFFLILFWKRKYVMGQEDIVAGLAYKVICLADVINPVEILYSWLPLTLCIIGPVHISRSNQCSIC